MTEKTSVILELDLGENGGTQVFTNEAELKLWIEAEIDWWKSLLERVKTADKRLEEKLTEFPNHLSRILKELPAKEVPQRYSHVKSRLTERFAEQPCSVGKYGQLISSESENDPALAGFMALRFSDKAIPNNGPADSRRQKRAEFLLAGFDSGVIGNTAEKASLESLRREWDTKLKELHDSFVSRDNAARDEIAALGRQRDAERSEHENQIAEHEQRMAKIEKRFTDEMAVRKAVTYWNSRSGEHATAAKHWGGAAVLAFVGGLLILWGMVAAAEQPSDTVARLIVAAGEGDIELTPEMIDSSLTKAWFASITNKVLFLILTIWPIRILVRNYLSNVHLSADASQRESIIQTYLALVNDPEIQSNGKLKEQVLPKALESIFRHTQTGIVRDDALPHGVFTFPKSS